jgi:O-antigen/teichoic acid export membrane protein
MSRSLRVAGGAGLGQVHLVVVTLVGLWLTPFLLARIGQERYGLWLLTLQLVGYLQLLDLGVVGLLPRETAYARGRAAEDATLVARTVNMVRGVIRWQMPLVAAGAVCAWAAIPDGWNELRGPSFWLLCFFVVTFPMRAYHATLQGLQDLVFLGQVQLAAWAIGTGVMIGLVLGGAGLVSIAAGWMVTQAVGFAACRWRLARCHASTWCGRASTVAWRDARVFLGRSSWVSVSQVGHVLLHGSDVLVIGALLGPAAVVPYACTAKLIQVLANHPQMLMQAAAPALSEMRVSESGARLAATTSALTRAMLVLSGAIGCVVIAVNEPFVGWWVGAEQYGGSGLTILLVLVMLARHLNTTSVYTIFCFGRERRTALTALADGIVTVAVSAALIPILGLHGVALGGLVGVLGMSAIPNLTAMAREIGVRPFAPLIELAGWAGRFGLCAAVAVGVAVLAPADGVWALAWRGTIVAAVYGVIMFPLATDGPLGGYVRQVYGAIGRRARTRPSASVP